MQSYHMGVITKKIYDSPIKLFSLKSLNDLLEITKKSSFYKVIKRLIDNEVLVKIERNKYCLKNYSCNDFIFANFIYEPSYISFESALSYYGILSQFPHEITSASTKQTKSKTYSGKQFNYYKIQNKLFWGYTKKENYLIADKEKALSDQIYLSSKGIKSLHIEELDLSLIDKNI